MSRQCRWRDKRLSRANSSTKQASLGQQACWRDGPGLSHQLQWRDRSRLPVVQVARPVAPTPVARQCAPVAPITVARQSQFPEQPGFACPGSHILLHCNCVSTGSASGSKLMANLKLWRQILNIIGTYASTSTLGQASPRINSESHIVSATQSKVLIGLIRTPQSK